MIIIVLHVMCHFEENLFPVFFSFGWWVVMVSLLCSISMSVEYTTVLLLFFFFFLLSCPFAFLGLGQFVVGIEYRIKGKKKKKRGSCLF